MSSHLHPPKWRPPRTLSGTALAITMLAGCQSYEPAPLDLARYSDRLQHRLIEVEPLSAFAHRLTAGHEIPSRFDPADGLTVAEGEVLALFFNPELRIARLEAGVALADWENAGLWEDPVFGFDGAEIISPQSPFEYGLMLSLTIPISGRLDIEKERAGAHYEMRLREIVDAEWRTRADVRSAWLEWTVSAEQVALIDDAIAHLEPIAAMASQYESAGEITRTQRRLFQIELIDLQIRRTEAELNIVHTHTVLLELLGLPPNSNLEFLPSTASTRPPMMDEDTARLIESNTRLAIDISAYRVAEDTLRLEVRKQFPDIVVGGGYGTEFNDSRAMFGVSVPIPIFNANRGPIATARAQREVARARAETTLAHLERAVTEARLTLNTATHQMNRYREHMIPLLDTQSEEVRRVAELGEIDALLMLDTTTRHLSAKQRLLELQQRAQQASIALHQLYGPDSPQHPAPIAQPSTEVPS